MSHQFEKVMIAKLPIRLGQFLKFINMAQDGFEATRRIQNGEVKVNGEIETKRGKKLKLLDEITLDSKTWRITSPL